MGIYDDFGCKTVASLGQGLDHKKADIFTVYGVIFIFTIYLHFFRGNSAEN